jgi:hypothetical protein
MPETGVVATPARKADQLLGVDDAHHVQFIDPADREGRTYDPAQGPAVRLHPWDGRAEKRVRIRSSA